MKLFGNILLAGLLSLIVGAGVTLALSALAPCYSDKAGCGLSEAFRLFFVPGYVLFAMVAFGISAAGQNRARPLKLTMFTLLLISAFLIFFAIGDDLTKGRIPSAGNLSDALQVTLSYAAVVLVQWQVILRFLRKRDLVPQVPA